MGGDRALFRFERVSVCTDGVWRLREVDAVVPDTGITAIVGPSGSGKSTLLRCCNRLVVPTDGRVLLHGADVADADVLALRRRVGMVFQRPTPFAGTGRDNLRVAAPELTAAAAARLFARVHLDEELLDRAADTLSGGEAQRLCLARSLAAEPDVLLMDEVTSSVDAAARQALEQLGRELAGAGVPVLWVSHDFAQVTRVASHVLVVLGGRVAHAGPLEQLAVGAPDDVLAFLREASDAE